MHLILIIEGIGLWWWQRGTNEEVQISDIYEIHARRHIIQYESIVQNKFYAYVCDTHKTISFIKDPNILQ